MDIPIGRVSHLSAAQRITLEHCPLGEPRVLRKYPSTRRQTDHEFAYGHLLLGPIVAYCDRVKPEKHHRCTRFNDPVATTGRYSRP